MDTATSIFALMLRAEQAQTKEQVDAILAEVRAIEALETTFHTNNN